MSVRVAHGFEELGTNRVCERYPRPKMSSALASALRRAAVQPKAAPFRQVVDFQNVWKVPGETHYNIKHLGLLVLSTRMKSRERACCNLHLWFVLLSKEPVMDLCWAFALIAELPRLLVQCPCPVLHYLYQASQMSSIFGHVPTSVGSWSWWGGSLHMIGPVRVCCIPVNKVMGPWWQVLSGRLPGAECIQYYSSRFVH